eukprot:736066-Rhodomonas_salina.1
MLVQKLRHLPPGQIPRFRFQASLRKIWGSLESIWGSLRNISGSGRFQGLGKGLCGPLAARFSKSSMPVIWVPMCSEDIIADSALNAVPVSASLFFTWEEEEGGWCEKERGRGRTRGEERQEEERRAREEERRNEEGRSEAEEEEERREGKERAENGRKGKGKREERERGREGERKGGELHLSILAKSSDLLERIVSLLLVRPHRNVSEQLKHVRTATTHVSWTAEMAAPTAPKMALKSA